MPLIDGPHGRYFMLQEEISGEIEFIRKAYPAVRARALSDAASAKSKWVRESYERDAEDALRWLEKADRLEAYL